jgi:hypothetical protein
MNQTNQLHHHMPDPLVREETGKSRRLTPRMLATLKECYMREIRREPPCDHYTKGTKGLFVRGLIYSRPYTDSRGKTYLGFYITEDGKDVLRKHSAKSAMA